MKAFKGTYLGINVTGVISGGHCHMVDINGGTWTYVNIDQVSGIVELEEKGKSDSALTHALGATPKEINIRF